MNILTKLYKEDFDLELIVYAINIIVFTVAFSSLAWKLYKKQILNFNRTVMIKQRDLGYYKKASLLLGREKRFLLNLLDKQRSDILKFEQDEKQYIAQSLHDTLGQNLSSCKLLLEMEVNQSNSEILSHGISQLNSSIQKTRELISLLSNSADLDKKINYYYTLERRKSDKNDY
jgi:signal transduction histidine kinase